jgi:hypothetical protein
MYLSFEELGKREHFSDTIDTQDIHFLSGEALQSLCDVTWWNQEKRSFHTSIPSLTTYLLSEPQHADKGNILFVYTDLLDEFIKAILPHRTKPFVLVTHNSDHSIDESHYSLLNNQLLVHMYSQNTFIRHKKLTAIPLGIANAMWKHGNQSHFKELIRQAVPFSEKKSKVYSNVNLSTNLSHRSKVMDIVNQLSFVDSVPSNKPHMEYLLELTTYKWVASPKGNGVDCHRLWETLYAKSIPLVDDTENTREFLEMGFPIILVKDWSQLTLDGLEEASKKLDINVSEKLDISYWKTKIQKHFL